jgi:hypothetical protein
MQIPALIDDNETSPTAVTPYETIAEMAGRMQHRTAAVWRPRKSRNWIWATLVLAASAWGFAGCAAHAPATVEQTENVGTLAAGPSVYSAPMKHDAPPELGFVAGSDDDSTGEVATTVTRVDAGEPDAAPAVEEKAAHGF